jgi:hypothetical protein
MKVKSSIAQTKKAGPMSCLRFFAAFLSISKDVFSKGMM